MKIITRKEAKDQGLINYFTGKPCKRGHITLRNVKSHLCIECRLISSQKWLKNNPDKIIEYNNNRITKSPEKVRAEIMNYRATHIDEYRNYQKLYHRMYRQRVKLLNIK